MKQQKIFLYGWGILLIIGAIGAYFYVKISSTPVFSVVSAKHTEDGSVNAASQKSWFDSIVGRDVLELYPATEVAFLVDMGEIQEEGKELYYVLSISKLGEDKFRIVEKKLNDLRVLYSVKREGDTFSVNISLKDKDSMQKLANEIKKSF